MIKEFKKWLRHRANSIQYKCPSCKVKLETNNDKSGDTDTCPNCGEVHFVPLSRQDKAKRKAKRKAEIRESVRKRQEAEDEALRQREKEAHDREYCLRITCPYCQGIFRAQRLSSGHHWICPDCGSSFGGDGSGSNGGDAMAGAFLGSMLFRNF
jgi:predicted RNA-binding Zn-ribbon protein involved in translation (DUF1610 family)